MCRCEEKYAPVCADDKACVYELVRGFLLSAAVLMEAAGCSLRKSQVARLKARRWVSCRAARGPPARLAGARDFNHSSHSQLASLPSVVNNHRAKNDCFLFIRISLCYRRRLVFVCFFLLLQRSVSFRHALAAGFTLPLLVRLPCFLSLPSLRPRSLAALSSARGCLPSPIYLHISSICLLPSLPF